MRNLIVALALLSLLSVVGCGGGNKVETPADKIDAPKGGAVGVGAPSIPDPVAK